MNEIFKKRNSKRKIWGILMKIAIFMTIGGFLAVVGVFAYFAKDLPSPGKINKRFIAESTKIFDRTGQHLLYEMHGEEKRTLIPFEEMPDSIKYATISLEDQDFYSHNGIKLTAIMRAALKDISSGDRGQGGSTITQQFVKNSILTREKTFTRKIKEVILSIELEQKFSKDEILSMYLNEIPYGSNAYGIEAAAQTFFDKSAKYLTLDEAALLAGLPKAPTYYSPYGSHIDEVKIRQEIALNEMAEQGYITKAQAEEAKGVDVFAKLATRKENIKAPHFVMYVREYLEATYGDKALQEGGFKVYTTLDWDKQQSAEEVVKEGAEKNLQKYNADNASLVAIDPKTGQILAMVGSKDYFDKEIDGQVNVAIRDRQPGSSFKPYVYLAAFMKGYTPETLLYDVETDFNTATGEEYAPGNYNGKFSGPVKMKNALAMSLNIPAVKTLYLVGVKDAINLAKSLGVTGLNEPDRYGLSLVLGGGEVKLLDHVGAYATLANRGVRNEKTAILKIEDKDGEVLEKFEEKPGEKIVDEKYIAMLDHILSTNKYRAPAFGANNPFRFDNRQVVAKTGTTNEYRDGWAIGYTPSISVGVWVGNNDNKAMKVGAAGANVAAPIWRSFMDKVLVNYNIEGFPKYEEEDVDKPMLNGEIEKVDKISICEIPDKKGEYCLANQFCPENEAKEREFINAHSILWYLDKDNPRGDYPENPERDPQFKKWEKGVAEWYEENEEKKQILGEVPKNECNQEDFPSLNPTIVISAIKLSDSQYKLTATVDAHYGADVVRFYIDGEEKVALTGRPFEFIYNVPAEKFGSTFFMQARIWDKEGNDGVSSMIYSNNLSVIDSSNENESS